MKSENLIGCLASVFAVVLMLAFTVILKNIHLTRPSGVLHGEIKEVTVEGIFIDSCEVGIQVGSASNAMDFSSTRDMRLCEKLKAEIGRVVKLSYSTPILTLDLGSDSKIEKFEVSQ